MSNTTSADDGAATWKIYQPVSRLPWKPNPVLPGCEDWTDEYQWGLAIQEGVTLYVAPDIPKVRQHNVAARKQWEAAQEVRRRESAQIREGMSVTQRGKRALGLLEWRCFTGTLHDGTPALARLARDSSMRDDQTNCALRYLAPLVNDGDLTREELRRAILDASERNGHLGDNKSQTQIDRDIDRAISKFTEPFDWTRLDQDKVNGSGIPAEVPKATSNSEPNGTEDDHEGLVEQRMLWLRANRKANRRLDAEERPPLILPPVKSLTALLTEPDTPTRYLIDRLAPEGGRVMLSAQYKAGKTTVVGNLLRCLVDGDPFLGTFAVRRPVRHAVLIDAEMSENTVRRWLRDQNITHTEAVADVIALRGKVSTFNLLDESCRQEWAARLRELGCDYLVLDCLRPVLDALGLDEKGDAGRFLVAFDALLADAGINDALIVHHMGHTNERARGDSRLQDWPDAIWRIVRESEEPGSARYFSAYGRDVDVHEGRLSFDPSNRRLTYNNGSRLDAQAEAARLDIIGLLAKSEQGLSKNAIESDPALADHARKPIRAGLRKAIAEGFVTVEDGPKRSKIHRINHPCEHCGMPVAGGGKRHQSCPE